ncbi:MAG: acyltransferase [Anaerolineales bacterium]|jgi:peptidoglycan/LPS O-acetylase OafA/YrhL|nr:acyltransferase [Anaerolineales bacterium]
MNERAKELDSLRGIAVILVIAFHVFKRAAYFTKHEVLHFISSLANIGWLGVDVFFVLSGFLITTILLKTKSGNNYFKFFYARRILRIFPLYYVFIAVMLALLPTLLPDYTPNIPVITPYLLLYIQNWIVRLGVVGLPAHLGATWSLAIEEQFYLIWPLVVYYFRREALIKIGLGAILFSFLYRLQAVLFWDASRQFAIFFYFDTFTRFSELIFGALLAVFFMDPAWRERIRLFSLPIFIVSFLTFAGLCIYLFPNWIPYYSNAPFTVWAYILIPLFSASLIGVLVTGSENNLIRRVFRNKILLFFGKYSYAMYLLHMPIALTLLDFIDGTHRKGWKVYLAYIVLTFALTSLGSLVTWHVLEKHMLNLKKYFEY